MDGYMFSGGLMKFAFTIVPCPRLRSKRAFKKFLNL